MYDYYTDQYLRGPGTPHKRMGVPIPEALFELQVAEWTRWRITPGGLRPGPLDSQPMAALLYWVQLKSEAAGQEERCHLMLRKQQESQSRRGRRR